MRAKSKGKADASGFERKRAKQAERRRPHIDKYGSRAKNNDNEEARNG